MCKFNDPALVPARPLQGQPLYPYTVSPTAIGDCLFTIEPRSAHVFPFWLCPGKTVLTGVTHTARVQDRSLQCWVSSLPIGQSVVQQPYSAANWIASRHNRMVIAVYDLEQPKPDAYEIVIPTTPGLLYLNVLNLVNSSNEYALRLTECGCDGTP